MQVEKYQKNYWNNMPLFMMAIFLFCIGCREKEPSYLELPIKETGLNSPYIATNIVYDDSVYHITIEEHRLFGLFPQIEQLVSREQLFPVLRDTFPVNDSIFKNMEFDIVKPTSWLTDLYNKGGKDSLLAVLEDNVKYPVDYYDQNHLIYLLFHEGVYVETNCESGYLMIKYSAK